MTTEEKISHHLRSQLGPHYTKLAVAKERDDAAKASDKAMFYILMAVIIVTGVLIFYRLWIHTEIRRETLRVIRDSLYTRNNSQQSTAAKVDP